MEAIHQLAEEMGLEEFKVSLELFQRDSQHASDYTLWCTAAERPKMVADWSDDKTVIIIDEFPDLDDKVWDKKVGDDFYGPCDMVAHYSELSNTRNAPMLVSGSVVSVLTRKVLGGPLGGRFGVKRIQPLSIEDGTELANKISLIEGLRLGEGLTEAISRAAGGNPFYISEILRSEATSGGIETGGKLEGVIEHEVTRGGRIFEFWDTHFADNMDKINRDRLAEKVVLYLTRYQGRCGAP